MEKPKRIALHIENFRGTLEVTCHRCDGLTRIPLESVSVSPIECECGHVYFLSENDLRAARKSAEEIRIVRNGFEKPHSST